MIARSLATAVVAVAVASPATAQTVTPASTATARATAPAPQRATVVRDAATGQLRAPTADEAAELAAVPAPSSARSARRAAPTPVRQSNGALAMEVDESLAMYSVARRNADGSISYQCVPGEAAARSLVRKAGPQPVVSKSAKEGALELQ